MENITEKNTVKAETKRLLKFAKQTEKRFEVIAHISTYESFLQVVKEGAQEREDWEQVYFCNTLINKELEDYFY